MASITLDLSDIRMEDRSGAVSRDREFMALMLAKAANRSPRPCIGKKHICTACRISRTTLWRMERGHPPSHHGYQMLAKRRARRLKRDEADKLFLHLMDKNPLASQRGLARMVPDVLGSRSAIRRRMKRLNWVVIRRPKVPKRKAEDPAIRVAFCKANIRFP